MLCFAVILVALMAAALSGAVTYAGAAWIRKRRSPDGEQARPWGIAVTIGVLIFPLVCIALSNVPFGLPRTPARKPKVDDIVGTWQPTSWSLERLAEAGYEVSTHTLVFHEDGTLEITNLPDRWWLDEPSNDFCSGTGVWEIESNYSAQWAIATQVQCQGNGVQGQIYQNFDLMGRRPPYTIYFYWGDPDSGEIFRYTRLQTPP